MILFATLLRITTIPQTMAVRITYDTSTLPWVKGNTTAPVATVATPATLPPPDTDTLILTPTINTYLDSVNVFYYIYAIIASIYYGNGMRGIFFKL